MNRLPLFFFRLAGVHGRLLPLSSKCESFALQMRPHRIAHRRVAVRHDDKEGDSRVPVSEGQRVRWFGVSLMMTTALAGIMAVVPARAQTPPVTTQADRRDFNIPPQALASGLTAFGRQSGTQITAGNDVAGNLTTAGVRGRMASAEALQRLLAGTGVTYAVTATGPTRCAKRPRWPAQHRRRAQAIRRPQPPPTRSTFPSCESNRNSRAPTSIRQPPTRPTVSPPAGSLNPCSTRRVR